MASLVNKYLHANKKGEQNLINGLIVESIQLMGQTYMYLPRDVILEDLIMGEDVTSKFGLAIPIEMYLSNPLGFSGDKEMFSKFGLEIKNSYKLIVAKSRWEREVKTQFDAYMMNGEANFTIGHYIRPREGDLIYDPITKFLMEITFVDHDAEFYALGKNYQYTLSCSAFMYQQCDIQTGVAAIDIFATNSTDMLLNQIILEDGSTLIFEQGGYALLEDGQIPVPVRTYGSEFNPEAVKISATVINPFA
jgi:hypothetical protein